MLDLNDGGCVRPALCKRCGSAKVNPPWTICWTCFKTEPPKPTEPVKPAEPTPDSSPPTSTGNTVPIWQLDSCSSWPVDGVAVLPEPERPKQCAEPAPIEPDDEPKMMAPPTTIVIPREVRKRFDRIHEAKPCRPPKPRRERKRPRPIVKPFTDEEREKYSQVVADNLPLIWYVVNKTPGLKERLMHRRDEALSVGMLALCYAARHHDPNRGTYATLAFVYIRNALLKLLTDERSTRNRRDREVEYGSDREERNWSARSPADQAAMRETLVVV